MMAGYAPDGPDWQALAPALLLFAAALVPALLRHGRERDFFLGGRRSGAWTVGASLLATVLGASGSLGIVALAYDRGWGAFWWLGSGAVGLMLLGRFWVPAMRRNPGVRTLPEWAGTLYGEPARVLAAGLIAVMWTAVIAAQWNAAGTVLAFFLPAGAPAATIVLAVLVTAYTLRGGQSAVLRTDRWQLPLILVAMAVALACARRLPAAAGGPAPAFPGVLFQGLTPGTWVALLVVVGGMYIVGPDLCSRVLVAADDRAASRGAFWAGLLLLPISVLVAAVGVRLRGAGIALENGRDAFPWLLGRRDVVPPPLAGVIGAGLLAAMVSSADTCLITAASVLELDLVRGRGRLGDGSEERRGRLYVLGVGAVSLLIALLRPGIIGNLLLAYSFYSGGLLLPLLLGIRRSHPFRRRPAWVWSAMAVGGVTPVLALAGGWIADTSVAGLAGVAACGAVLLLGTLRLWDGRCPASGV